MFCMQVSFAEIYKWVDERGNAHFTDKPPSNKKVEEVTVKINTYSAVQVTPLVERLGKKGKVVMYTATWCGICKKAEKYFRKNKIAYVAYDVEKSRIGKMDFKLLKGRSVNGFNRHDYCRYSSFEFTPLGVCHSAGESSWWSLRHTIQRCSTRQ